MLIQELQEIQQQHGYLPDNELRDLAERTHTPLYRLQEVVSFYPHFHRHPPPKIDVRVCRDMACNMFGGRDVCERLMGLANNQLAVGETSCLGRCDRAPVMCMTTHGDRGEDFRIYTNLSSPPNRPAEIVEQAAAAVLDPDSGASIPTADEDQPWSKSGEADNADKWEIDIYRDEDPENRFASVRAFVRHSVDLQLDFGQEPEPGKKASANIPAASLDESLVKELCERRNLGEVFSQERDEARKRVVAALYTAGLLGMGGAGGRAYKKWFDVRKAARDNESRDKYVVCNGDESEPGTFKDREILLRFPHLVVEAVVLAGLFLRARAGFIYIRHEYQEQIEAVREAIRWAEKRDLCGEKILNTGASFPVEVIVSPGGYICGEQTALIEALEGQRAEPRNRPPNLQENGLWNKPTLVNNVETLAWVPAIVMKGDGAWFEQRRGPDFKCRRLFSISGDVEEPGVYEVPSGITLKTLVDLAGGLRKVVDVNEGHVAGSVDDDDETRIKAVALSGPSGGFLPEHVPRSLVEDALKKLKDQIQPSWELLQKAANDLAKETRKLQQLTEEVLGEVNEVTELRNFTARLPDSLPSQAPASDSLETIFADLAKRVESWQEQRKSRHVSVPRKLVLQEQLADKYCRRAMGTGDRYQGIFEACIKQEKLFAELFNNGEPASVLQLELDIGKARRVGYMLGAGIVIYGRHRDIVAEALNCTKFFRNESCGKCVPCRIGSQKLVEIARQLCGEFYDTSNWETARGLVEQLAPLMVETSICGLGEVASRPLKTLINYFPEDVQAKLKAPPSSS